MKTTDAGEILRLAADKYLAHTHREWRTGKDGDRVAQMSCVAVVLAFRPLKFSRFSLKQEEALFKFLRDLGCDTTGLNQFPEQWASNWEEVQEWRYSWLMFAADLADEWRIELAH